MNKYYFEDDGFVIEGFDRAATFCSFLPGLAGAVGVPLWCFYVNRGQGVCSFGVENKDGSIMEFSPANSAYRRVGREGFRTFIKMGSAEFEPFSTLRNAERKMTVKRNSFSIEEIGDGLKFTVTYFVLPSEPFAALVRDCRITNVGGESVDITALDGLTEIIPYGVTTGGYKSVSNLNKSWAEVSRLRECVPFYSTRSVPADEAEVEEKTGGYFYLSFKHGENKPVRPVTDPALIFGYDTGYAFPQRFVNEAPETQTFVNKYSCGFTPVSARLGAGEGVSWTTFVGFHGDPERFVNDVSKHCSAGYVAAKLREAAELEEKLTKAVETATAMPLFDGYIRQSYLDNLLRGGQPSVVGGKVIHTFSRKHGDPERDYNFFSLSAEYFSQGNGNFRDVCQNRRNDAFFNPAVAEFNVVTFFSLMQADGFNPLEVRGSTFEVEKRAEFDALLHNYANGDIIAKVCERPFTAGKLVNAVYGGRNVAENEAFKLLEEVLPLCRQNIEAGFGEGYWIDHWTYLMDLVDSYLAVFPDRKAELLFGNRGYRFFVSPVAVLPRREAYVYKNGKLRQYKSLRRLDGKRGETDHGWLKTADGNVYETDLFAKMVCLAAVKFSTLDPEGMGLSMDGGKPGWNDAMNGLPGLFGSGVGETYELLRLTRFVNGAIEAVKNFTQSKMPTEVVELLRGLYGLRDLGGFEYWDRASSLKEDFRAKLYENGCILGETWVSAEELKELFAFMTARLEDGLKHAEELGERELGGLVPTYLTFEPTGLDGAKFPTGFKASPLPAFLEGPARGMKTYDDKQKCINIHKNVLNSGCYDRELKMFKTSAALEGDFRGYDVGRVRAFTPGWLERESVFLHMSLKYVLELLRAGLYREFFEALNSQLPPFLDPAVYGRNVMENSSFIASSVNPDESVVGRGFVSRLSGSTAEVLSVWRLMFWGAKGFFLAENGELAFSFAPVLNAAMFGEAGEVSFQFLGNTKVLYRNAGRRDLFGESPKRVVLTRVGGGNVEIAGGEIVGSLALELRDGGFETVLAEF